jgi:membrane-bound lytic murein transglycosylase B
MRARWQRRWFGLPLAALAAGLPALLAGMLVAPSPATPVGADGDTVRTVLAADQPQPAEVGDPLDGAHPVTDPGTATQVLDIRLDSVARDDRNRGVPVRVSGTALPARVLLAYRNAAASLRDSDAGCHLSWSLVAGIGKVESGHAFGGAVDRKGRTVRPILGPVLDGAGDFAAIPDTDGGRWDGDTTWDRAVGPMQFIPSSWAVWGRDGDGNGSTDPSDIDDAALATASYLCAGDRDLTVEKDRRSAVFSYNHSWDYVDLVLAWADAYATGSTITGTLAGQGGHARDGAHGEGSDELGPPIGATPKPTPPTPEATPAVAAGPPASAVPTVEPSPAPSSATPEPAATTSASPTPTPDPTGTAVPPGCPTPTPTDSGTPDPSGSTTPDPTPTPDPTITPDPSGTPTDSPTPTATPTDCPTP